MPAPQQLTLFGLDVEGDARQSGTRRLVQLGTRIVAFRFVRSRRRTIGISIDADGLSVAAPHYAPWVEIERFLLEKSRWVLAKLDEWSKAGRPVRILGVSGESVPVRGRSLVLDLRAGEKSVALAGDTLCIRLRRPHEGTRVKAELLRWLKLYALENLAPRVAHYASRLGRPTPHVGLSNARTQWGVCTQDGKIRLSWRLVHVAPELADYVVAHEVAHLVELNHSPRFWEVVESLYPDCRSARRSLDLAAAALPIF
ncbi:MAG: SprT family zinc-dependent metalloprotease [Betaproteobacteria bacterium]